MPNQTVKNGLKAKKIKLPQMNFFLKKQLIKFSCTYWLLSFCKILKKFLEQIQSYEMCHLRAQNGPFVKNKFFLVQTIIITFIYLLALLMVQNLKNSYSVFRVIRMRHLWAQNCPVAPFFGGRIINIILIYLLALMQNFKKVLPGDPEL